MSHNEHGLDNGAHVVPIAKYAQTLVALFILMAITLWAAFVQFPGGTIVNNLIAMGIAVTKATLVISIFMGVKYSTNLTKLFAAMGFIWFTMLFMIFADYYTRPLEMTPSWDSKDYGSAMPRVQGEEPLGGKGDDMTNIRPR